MTYQEQLKNPKWQKLRLKILERDNWTCQGCGEKEKTLHVHHKLYIQGLNPWDYKTTVLITLCDSCHKLEHDEECRKQRETLMAILDEMFLQSEKLDLANVFFQINGVFDSQYLVDMLLYLFRHKNILSQLKTEFNQNMKHSTKIVLKQRGVEIK